MTYQILSDTAASITDLKKNPMGTIAGDEGNSVAILNRNKPAFYCAPPELFALFMKLAEDVELNKVADERLQSLDAVSVNIDDL